MSSPESFPRVLFITPHAFNKVTGTGITFSNLFRGWPKDRISTVHDDTIAVTTDVCDSYYQLGSDEIRKFGGSLTNKPSPQFLPQTASTPPPQPRPKSLQAVKKLIFGDGLPQRGVLTPRLEAWIEDFCPDVIYTILGSNGLMDIVEEIERKFNVPMVVHIMDDWMSGAFRNGLLGQLQRQRMLRSIRRIVEKADLRLGICDAMCEAYSDRFGVPFGAFQNVADVAAIAKYATDPTAIGKPVKVVYAGSVFAYAQLQSLIDCCQAVAQLSNEGAALQLDIHCPPSHITEIKDQLTLGPVICLHDSLIDDDDFFSTICNADILLMPVNFDQKSIDFIRYSMPTRVPAYMASGTPILVYGPADVAQVQYAKKAGWGLVVENRDINALKEGVMSLMKERSLRAQLSDRAGATSLARHDMKRIHEKFKKSLAALLGDSGDRMR